MKTYEIQRKGNNLLWKCKNLETQLHKTYSIEQSKLIDSQCISIWIELL